MRHISKDKNYAKSYNKGALYEVFLNIRKPLATEGKWTGVINKDRATGITGKYGNYSANGKNTDKSRSASITHSLSLV